MYIPWFNLTYFELYFDILCAFSAFSAFQLCVPRRGCQQQQQPAPRNHQGRNCRGRRCSMHYAMHFQFFEFFFVFVTFCSFQVICQICQHRQRPAQCFAHSPESVRQVESRCSRLAFLAFFHIFDIFVSLHTKMSLKMSQRVGDLCWERIIQTP